MIKLKRGRMLNILGRGLLTLSTSALVLTSSLVGAQTVPTGYQDYFVLGFEQHVWDMMDKVREGEDSSASFADAMNSVVTAVASADNQVLFYDHWEDGFEADILNPVPGTTLVLGNNDSSDGRACDFTTDPRVVCGTADEDLLFEGTFLTLASDVEPADCVDIDCQVPLNPRDSDDIRFDGGDRIVTSGGPLSVIHNQNPLNQYIGGATENISYQTVEAARSYSIPIGEDIYDDYGGEFGDTRPFKYVDVGLVAFEDDTAVFVDSPGETPVSFVLNRGESYSSLGLIDGRTAPSIVINAGTKVSTDKGVAGFIHTGGDGTYATRFYTLLPDLLHATDYVITAPGDDPTEPSGTNEMDRPANIYIFNPDPITDIEVTATDTVGTVVIDVPANSSVPYSDSAGANRDVPPGSTVRMVSDRRFWGVSAYDYSTWAADWGHSWLARRFLTGIYTVGWAPGSTDITPPNRLNSSPVYVSATQDNTQVLIDLDNDDLFDQVDLDGNGTADPPDLPGNIYIVDALGALSIFDHIDYDNTGTRIVANKPVAVAWGQETDIGLYGDLSHDTGYTVYPINQLFLDPVLTLDKLADTETVPLAGGVVNYTLTVSSYDFGPLINLDAYDVLPAGVPESAYLTGSTLITYPNLAQDTTDPGISTDPETGRVHLDWSLSPDTIDAGQYITIQYSVDYGSATVPGLLINTGHARGDYGNSTFSPVAYESVVQTDAVLVKTVTHDGTPEVGETVSYTLSVENTGLADETDVVITDPVPPDTTFSTGSITSPVGPFSGSYDPGQNAVVWTASPFAAGAGPYDLEFDVVINPGVEAETALMNEAGYESSQTPYFVARANLVTTGPRLEYEKLGPSIVQAGDFAAFDILVHNTGVAAADAVTIIDSIPLNTTYVPGSMEWSLNSGTFTTLTDADDGDQGSFVSGRVEFEESLLGPGEDIVFRFSVAVDPGTEGEFVNNQATIYSTELPPGDTNLVQIPVGDAEITGVVFLDLDGDGTRDPSEPGVPYVDVVVTDSQGNTLVVSTDAAGEYSAFVVAGNATVDVDESDPDFPPGATLSTANDPQVVNAQSGSSTPAQPVGYEPPELTFSKVSDALNSEVSPGQTVTYTMTLTNNTDTTQTGISIQDALPTGTSYVSGSSQVTTPGSRSLRVTEYYLPSDGGFSGDTYDLTLDQVLADDYFVMIRGSDGDGGSGDNDRRGPDENYVSLVADPSGTGDLGTSGAGDRLSFTRQNSIDNWTGVITVVECLADCSTNGFSLVDVARITHTASASGTATLPSGSWSDIDQVLLMGGHNGAGCDSTEGNSRRHRDCHLRFVPSGSDEIDWSRRGNSAGRNAVSTVMAIEWGSSWTVQDVRVQGDNGGGGANQTGEYNTSALPVTVNRANTWVWGTGFTNDNGLGDTAEGCLITLGNGVAQNATENQVSVGLEYDDKAVDFQVWAMTHSDLVVDYEFEPDGNDNDLIVDRTVAEAGSERMALAYNGMGTTDSRDWPAAIFSARYVTDTTIRMQRRFSDYTFPAWIQGADFSAFTDAGSTAAGGSPPNLVIPADGYTLAPNESLVVTFDVVVDLDLDPSLIQISNTATADTDQEGPVSANATDDVLRAGVSVEPNNASYGVPGSTVVYSHEVINTGTSVDSFDITPQTEQNWPVELLHPDTGAILAQDLDGDGVWDNGVTINTGSLPVGSSTAYDLRVTIPVGTPADTSQASGITATSVRVPTVSAAAYDETLVVDSLGEVIVTPDNSGVIAPSGTVAYSHRVVNLTGSPETLDLFVDNSQAMGWTSTIHWDTNGDGQYTPGVDLEIANTRRLEHGESQQIFVVVTADNQPHGTVNVSYLTAVSRTDPNLLDGATDTTTVLDEPIDFDLSGGGTRHVEPGDLPVFPGRLRNLGDSPDTYDLTITASPYLGNDGLLHPTQLVIDSNADGVPDLLIAEDFDGDGIWDSVDPAYDTNNGGVGDGNPDLTVAGGGAVAYELRRPVDPAQTAYRDPVTLTAQSWASGDEDSVTATNLYATESYAVLSAFESYSANGRVVVEWRTAVENGTIGFDLFRRDPGKEEFSKVNKQLLAGLFDSPQGGTYRFLDPGGLPGARTEYILVEKDIWGQQTRLGPFLVQAEELPRDDPRRNGGVWRGSFLAESRHESHRSPGTGVFDTSGQPSGMLKIAVREEGLVWVPTSDLAAAFGVRQSRLAKMVHSGALRLTNRGEDVAWVPENGGAGLYFFGEAIDSIYTLDNIYWLELADGPTMIPVEGKPPSPAGVGSFRDTLHFEEEYYQITALVEDPEGDFWAWDWVYSDTQTNGSASLTLDTPHVAETERRARVAIGLQGAMASLASPNHHVRISLNGKQIGELMWDDLESLAGSFLFPQELLVSGSNQLTIEGILVPGTTEDGVIIDSVDIEYYRELRTESDQLIFSAAQDRVMTVDGFSSDEVQVFCLNDRKQPEILTGTTILPSANGFMVSFDTGKIGGEFLAVVPGSVQPGHAVTVDYESNLRSTGNTADHLIIAGSGLAGAAQVLADHRSTSGLQSLVVNVEDVYDEFNHGIVNPWAIRDFIQWASSNWVGPPKYVLLAGDSSFDYVGRYGTGENLVPGPQASSARGLFVSENILADFVGDDGVPELSIGRLPAQSAGELGAMIDKTIAFENSDSWWKDSTLWVSDEPDKGGEFIVGVDKVVELLEHDYTAYHLVLEDAGMEMARDVLTDRLETGTAMLGFLGHAGMFSYAPDPSSGLGVLMSSDVDLIENRDRTPVVIALTCIAGRFDIPLSDILAETLLLQPNGGAVAVWGPSGFSMNEQAVRIGTLFAETISEEPRPRLGDAVRSALGKYAGSRNADPAVAAHFVLLGDPALELD